MSKTTIETEGWRLAAYLQWRPKKKEVVCDYCGGDKQVGGGFADIDGPRQCYKCNGSGRLFVDPKEPEPAIPKDLVDHMKKAWEEYLNKE